MLDRVAIISDVHGNVTALQAVLADIQARGITRIVNLGDVIGKGPRGSEAVRLVRAACEATVRGNWDTSIARQASHDSPSGQWTRDELSAGALAWLAALPGTFTGAFRAGHATPFRAGHAPGPGATPDVVGYGDIHTAYLKASRGLTLFNVGSTGNHLDAPSAPYVIIEGVANSPDPASFSVSFARVTYDIQAEISVARELGMPDADAYARELLDGIYRGQKADWTDRPQPARRP